MDEWIELLTVTRTLTTGHYTETLTVNGVWAEERSVKRSEFYQAYESRLSEGDRDILNVFLHYKDSFKNKWKIVMSPEYQRASNWQERMRKAVLLLFNKI